MKTVLQQSQLFDKKLLAVPLKECGEPMTRLDADVPIQYGLSVCPFFRVSVVHALSYAAQKLHKKGYTLVLFDGYRSISTQKQKFFQYVDVLKKKYLNTTKINLYSKANTYIAGIPILAAHISGAAVDVGLTDNDGKFIDMGTPYCMFSAKSKTTYSGISCQAKKHRSVLCHGMKQAGFTNYPFEWWHYSMGDVCATYCSHAPNAIYGPVEYDWKNKKTIFLPDTDLYMYFLNK